MRVEGVTKFVVLLLLMSCGARDIPFEKSKWNERVDMFYRFRESMVNDLMLNHLRQGMPYSELIILLGKPENYAGNELNKIVYEIAVDYGRNIDPVEGENLYLELGSDSSVVRFWLDHWEQY